MGRQRRARRGAAAGVGIALYDGDARRGVAPVLGAQPGLVRVRGRVGGRGRVRARVRVRVRARARGRVRVRVRVRVRDRVAEW